MSALRPRRHRGWGSRVDPTIRDTLVQLATTPPREMGLKFTTWTLHELTEYLVSHEAAKDISEETVRKILRDEGIDWREPGNLPEHQRMPNVLRHFIPLDASLREARTRQRDSDVG